MSGIIWDLPGPDDRGFLRRRREIIELLDAEPSKEGMDAILAFLLPYVKSPRSRKAAMSALLDCSRVEYGKAVLSFLGLGNKISDPKGGQSVEQ